MRKTIISYTKTELSPSDIFMFVMQSVYDTILPFIAGAAFGIFGNPLFLVGLIIPVLVDFNNLKIRIEKNVSPKNK